LAKLWAKETQHPTGSGQWLLGPVDFRRCCDGRFNWIITEAEQAGVDVQAFDVNYGFLDATERRTALTSDSKRLSSIPDTATTLFE
jgi:hypothetical protein